MNRYIKNFLSIGFFTSFIVLFLFIYYPALGKISLNKGFEQKDKKNEDSTFVLKGYAPEESKWIEFKIPAASRRIKITSNATFYFNPREKSFPYSINYEILDKSGNILLSNTYFQLGKINLYKGKGSNRILSEPFLIDGNAYLTKNSDIVIPLQKINNAVVLKVRWIKSDAFSGKIIIRASKMNEFSEKKHESYWMRITEGKKKELAQNSIFPFQELKTEEIENILSSKWKYLTLIPKEENVNYGCRIGTIPRIALKLLRISRVQMDSSEDKKIKSEIFRLYLQSAGGVFKIPSLKNIKKAEALFQDIFNQNKITNETINKFAELGFDLKEIKKKNNYYIVVHEKEGHKQGKGFYIFCRNSKIKNCSLEIPHRFFDDQTGIIGFKMLVTGNFSAAAWNTVHRYQTPNNMTGSSDMAHNKRSYFHAFTQAFRKSNDANVLLQLHGFNGHRHNLGKDFPCVILSEGKNESNVKFLDLSNIIKSIIKIPVFIYPIDNKIEELSAQGNIAAADFLKSKTQKIFVHFEMNKLLRDKFIADKAFLKYFSITLNNAAGKINE